jgi:integrase/recombinase XerC
MSLVGEDARRAADTWLKELAEQRRLSPHTVEAYGRDLEALLEMAGATPLEQLQPQDIRRAIARLHARNLSGRSLARMLSAWRGFYRWLGKRKLVALNPVQTVRPPRSKKALPSALSPDQAHALLEGAVEDVLELRDRAMFELFYSSGLRLSELASLDCRGGLDLKEGEVTVTGKRGKTRLVPVGAAAREALAAWLTRRDEIATGDEPALFLSRRGTRLAVRSIEARLERWGLKQGLGVHVHPHMLRHSFASHVLQSSGDLRAVQEMLGHSSIASTQIYTHLDFQHLAQVYDAAHPRARKK